MPTQPESAIKQRTLIAKLNLNPSTMAYRVFKDFIENSNYYDGELEIIHRSYKLPPTAQVTLDCEDRHLDKVLKAITVAQKVLLEGNIQPLVDAQSDSKYFAYETMFEEAMDYIYDLLPYDFLRYSSAMVNNPVYVDFKEWFFDLPLQTDLDELADECVSKYMDLLLSYVKSGTNGAVGWKPDFQ